MWYLGSHFFLVNTREMVASSAAQIVTLYYLGIMIGRLVSGIVASRVTSWHIIFGGQLILLLGIGMLLLPLSVVLAGTGLFLIGFGNSTVFPNLIFFDASKFWRRYFAINYGNSNGGFICGHDVNASIVWLIGTEIGFRHATVFYINNVFCYDHSDGCTS